MQREQRKSRQRGLVLGTSAERRGIPSAARKLGLQKPGGTGGRGGQVRFVRVLGGLIQEPSRPHHRHGAGRSRNPEEKRDALPSKLHSANLFHDGRGDIVPFDVRQGSQRLHDGILLPAILLANSRHNTTGDIGSGVFGQGFERMHDVGQFARQCFVVFVFHAKSSMFR